MAHDSARFSSDCVLGLRLKVSWKPFPLTCWKQNQTPGVCSAMSCGGIIKKICAEIVSECRSTKLGSRTRKSFYDWFRVFRHKISVQMQNSFIDMLCRRLSRGSAAALVSGEIASQWVMNRWRLAQVSRRNVFLLITKLISSSDTRDNKRQV